MPLFPAPSLRLLNLGALDADLAGLRAAGVTEVYVDVADGVFVREFGFNAATIRAIKASGGLACTAHLRMQTPEPHIERLAQAGCDSITVHVETCKHAHRTLGQIRDAGAAPGIAINPGTALTKLEYLLPEAERVLVLTAEPGLPGRSLMPMALERVRLLGESIRYRKLKARIFVAGNFTIEDLARLAHFGAAGAVLGVDGPLRRREGESWQDAFARFTEALAVAMKTG